MLRNRLACVKPAALALFAAVLTLGAAEVALRVHHSWSLQAQSERLDFQTLSMPCWKCHHALKPLKSTVRRNPDTQLAIPIRTNHLGLRGESVAIPKPEGVFRIVYLGDDAVFASEVAEEDSFCQLIAAELGGFRGQACEVINAGIPGYCPLLSYLQFQHSLASLQPDLLILNFDMSDVSDDHYYRRHAKLGAEGLPLICMHSSLQSPPNGSVQSTGGGLLLIQALKRQLGLLPADESRVNDQDEIGTPQGRYAWTREDRPDWQIYIAQALAPMEELWRVADQLSCPLFVTLSPVPWQVSERAMPDPAARQSWGITLGKAYDPHLATRPVIEYLESHTMTYYDASGDFRDAQKPEQLFLETAPRFSREGHRVFARGVSGLIRRAFPPARGQTRMRSAQSGDGLNDQMPRPR